MTLRRQLGNDYNLCLDDSSHSIYPSACDREVDPDPHLAMTTAAVLQIIELELLVERLKAERNHFGWHRRECRTSTRDDEGCECGWQQTQHGTLWDLSGDITIDIHRAVDSWHDAQD
jgi:adenine-specific DNA methylase